MIYHYIIMPDNRNYINIKVDLPLYDYSDFKTEMKNLKWKKKQCRHKYNLSVLELCTIKKSNVNKLFWMRWEGLMEES